MQLIIGLWYIAVLIVGCSGFKCSSSRHLTRQGDGRRSIPPLVSSVTVSSYASGYLSQELFAFDLPSTDFSWCHDENQPTDSEINITISMKEPVVLYGLLSGGYSAAFVSYVTAFSVAYSYNDSTGEAKQLPEIFNVTEIVVATGPNNIPLVLLPEAIVMDTLYLEVVDYFSDSFNGRAICWTLALLGCPLSEAQEETPAFPHTSSPTPSPTLTLATDSLSEGCGERRDSGSDAVAIAVSTAVITVAAVAVLVAFGVGLCWVISRSAGTDGQAKSSGHTLRRVENELYTNPPNRVAVDGYEPMQSSSDPGEQATINPAPVYNYVSTDPRPTTTTNINGDHQPGAMYEAVVLPADSLVENPAYLTTTSAGAREEFLADQSPDSLAGEGGYEAMAPRLAGEGVYKAMAPRLAGEGGYETMAPLPSSQEELDHNPT